MRFTQPFAPLTFIVARLLGIKTTDEAAWPARIVLLFHPLTLKTFSAILLKTTANAFSLWLELIHEFKVFG